MPIHDQKHRFNPFTCYYGCDFNTTHKTSLSKRPLFRYSARKLAKNKVPQPNHHWSLLFSHGTMVSATSLKCSAQSDKKPLCLRAKWNKKNNKRGLAFLCVISISTHRKCHCSTIINCKQLSCFFCLVILHFLFWSKKKKLSSVLSSDLNKDWLYTTLLIMQLMVSPTRLAAFTLNGQK